MKKLIVLVGSLLLAPAVWADIDVFCKRGGCYTDGWFATDNDAGTFDRSICTLHDCSVRGWTTELPGGAITKTTCTNGSYFGEGYTEAYFDIDLNEDVELRKVSCRTDQGTRTCHGKGWRDFSDGGPPYHVACINGDCATNGWQTKVQGEVVSTTTCKNYNCFWAGWSTRTTAP